MKKKITIILALFIAFFVYYFGGRFIYFGSLSRNCIYTENEIPIPEQLAKGEIVIAKDSYLAVGVDKEYACLNQFGSINRNIIGSWVIDNISIGEKYFTSKGMTVMPLEKGKIFKVTDIIALTKHGFSTIDSGPGPIYYLVLKDQDNILYQISIASLGFNKEELFLSFRDSSQSANDTSIKLLDDFSFDTPEDNDKVNTFIFTGKLVEIKNSNLK